MKRKGGFDAIIVETTGLADPGPVAQTFFVDEDVRAKTQLDSVTTVVDAKHMLLRLADSQGGARADRLRRPDRAQQDRPRLRGRAARGRARIRRLNPLAPIHRAQRSNVPLDAILGRGGFDLDRIVELEPEFLNPAHGEAGHVHDEDCEHDHDHDHHGHDHHDHDHGDHGHDIRQAERHPRRLADLDKPLDGNRVTRWLNDLLQTQGADILRAKGILDVAGRGPPPGVPGRAHDPGGRLPGRLARRRATAIRRMVFIGRNLDEAELRDGFEATAA